MIRLKQMEELDVAEAANVIITAYREEPWNEEYNVESTKCFLMKFISSETRPSYVLLENEKIIGVALGILIPSIEGDYLRIEDFCILPEKQKQGIGSKFLDMIKEQVKLKNADSILLGTQRGYPAHSFYLKNHFKEVSTAMLLYCDIAKEDC